MKIKNIDFSCVEEFENKISNFFGSPYAVAIDSCTHGIELCLRLTNAKKIKVPKRTYLSVPFLSKKLNLDLEWSDEVWQDYYYLTDRVVDAAVLWRRNSYVKGTFMCLSFQYQKHLPLGRAGMILCDNKEDFDLLKKMSYDGRLPGIPWRDQDIKTIGYHYYMTPESAKLGIQKFEELKDITPRVWKYTDWPDLTEMTVFKEKL
jgi:dTDP-4-amino-4,6-dideoxygalactose transaminase